MSRIWDSIRAVERMENQSSGRGFEGAGDRRCGPRRWAYTPVFVYGRTERDEPFYEPTEALRVNAGGGLITLTTAMTGSCPLLLINKVNHKEQKCHVVGHRGSFLNRSAVAFEFSEAAPDFGDGIP